MSFGLGKVSAATLIVYVYLILAAGLLHLYGVSLVQSLLSDNY